MTREQAVQLLAWYRRNRDSNWGTWDKDYLPGSSYLAYDRTPVVVKFDKPQQFGNLKFRRVCSRAEKETDISFRALESELGDPEAEIAAYEGARAERRAENERKISEMRRQRWLAEHPLGQAEADYAAALAKPLNEFLKIAEIDVNRKEPDAREMHIIRNSRAYHRSGQSSTGKTKYYTPDELTPKEIAGAKEARERLIRDRLGILRAVRHERTPTAEDYQ